MKKFLVIANLSWNRKGWKEPIVNPKAHHKYATRLPGHESLNFDFNKSIDTNNIIHGYVETTGRKFRQFENGGLFIFYSYNTDDNIGQIIGIYGNVEVLNETKTTFHKSFENEKLASNLKANKNLSILFPIYIDSNKYKKYNNQKRLTGQIGFSYYEDKNLLEEIIFDEIKLLENSPHDYIKEITTLKSIYSHYMDQEFDFDNLEQQYLQDIEISSALIDEDVEKIQISNTSYKRNNVLIAKIKKERGYKCQICQTQILKSDGKYYIEAAHIVAKKDKGNESENNILILCPNHHKEFDYSHREIIKHTNKKIHFKLNNNEYELFF